LGGHAGSMLLKLIDVDPKGKGGVPPPLCRFEFVFESITYTTSPAVKMS
jgi:hypothetical protein